MRSDILTQKEHRTAGMEIAVLIPCYNEAQTIAQVIEEFLASIPEAVIYVFDNNSTDGTAELAAKAGALVRREQRQGKGFVVRRMFRDISADVYVLVDGDATYHAATAKSMIELILSGDYEMVVAKRIEQKQEAYRYGHRFGNKLLTHCTAILFGSGVTDMLSGYRALSRRFVKSFPVLSRGFEIETELTIHALGLALPVVEIDSPYFDRPHGSESKLRTWSDGFRILRLIILMFRDEQPFRFYFAFGCLFAVTSIILSVPIFEEFVETGLVPRFPTAILSTGLMLIAFLAFAVGLILDSVTRGRREAKLLKYLEYESDPTSKAVGGSH